MYTSPKASAVPSWALALSCAALLIGCEGRPGAGSYTPGDGSEAERASYADMEKQATAGDLDHAFELVHLRDWQAGDRREAVENFKPIARAGNVKAASFLVYAYLRGDGVEVDTLEAVRWLRVGAESGSEEMARDLAAFEAHQAKGAR